MFFLPPPPRYNTSTAYAAGVGNGLPIPLIETTNTVKHPEGGCPLDVSEGTYVHRDDVHLATPPPHPSEPPQMNYNPLSTVTQPPSVGVKVTPVIINPLRDPPDFFKTNESSKPDLRIIKESGSSEGRHSTETGSSNRVSNGNNPAFGEGTLALASTNTKDSGSKRRKPKNSMLKSTSSAISRVITNDFLLKKLSDRSQDGLYVFANINRAFEWMDFSGKNKQDPLVKVLFMKWHVLAHDVNQLTKSTSHMDVVMGFASGDFIWYEPMAQKYTRINKNASVCGYPVTQVKWIPRSESLFLAAHTNGSLVVYDKEKDDAPFVPEHAEEDPANVEIGEDGVIKSTLQVLKSVKSLSQKTNPVAYWKFSNRRINDFAFSPDCRHLAIVFEDGTLSIMDYLEERLLDVFTSYYGGILCVCWSPDGNYIVTGGQDDLVSIWSFQERKLVARCYGHHSWVSSVAFDPWRCDERTYRFGSVGDDCRLLLWDFSHAMLHRPKVPQVNSRKRNSIASSSIHRSRADTGGTNRPRADSFPTEPVNDRRDGPVYHPAEARDLVPKLPPIVSKIIGDDPVSWVGFLEDSIMTSSAEGHINTWDRPEETAENRKERHHL